MQNNNTIHLKDRLYFWLARAKGIGIETNPGIFNDIILKIKEHDFSGFTDAQLLHTALDTRARVETGVTRDEVLPITFALVYEATLRALGIHAYDEQLAAAIALHNGKLAQMQTGEGKTLAIVFYAVVSAFGGSGVHVLTANDYLATRDASWMEPVYNMVGLRARSITEGMGAAQKKEGYNADVTYITAKEAGFDFLRDGLCYDENDVVQRGLDCAIVDEADFLLIDESRVPLVIAAKYAESGIDVGLIDQTVRKLCANTDYSTDKNGRRVYLTLSGERKVGSLLGCGGMHEERFIPLYSAVTVALHAHVFLERDRDYIVQENRIELVDELTGRIACKRRWPYGIQAALRAKEGLIPEEEGRVYGTITIRHLMEQYIKISALTATAVSAAAEFQGSYGLDIVVIPPHETCIRIDEPDFVFATMRAKKKAIASEVVRVHETGRPILIGTRSVSESEELAAVLRERNVECTVLNAKNDGEEARCIARAGMLGAVTVSTNMAGRGTDIKLGGELGENRETIVRLGGLYVIGTNKHENVRTDNQLRGRAGRQGDPGSSRFFVSLEDELFVKYGIREFVAGKYLASNNDEPISDRAVLGEINRAQAIVEDQHFEVRRLLYRYSEIVERQRRYVSLLRWGALMERAIPEEVWAGCSDKLGLLSLSSGEKKARDTLRFQFLAGIDRFWASHLAFLEDVKEGIYLRRLGGREPLLEFIRESGDAFDAGIERMLCEVAEAFNGMPASEVEHESEKEYVSRPSSTWTYTVSDDPFPAFNVGMFASRLTLAVIGGIIRFLFILPVTALASLFDCLKRK